MNHVSASTSFYVYLVPCIKSENFFGRRTMSMASDGSGDEVRALPGNADDQAKTKRTLFKKKTRKVM